MRTRQLQTTIPRERWSNARVSNKRAAEEQKLRNEAEQLAMQELEAQLDAIFDLDPAVNFTTFWSEAVPPYPACPVNATRYPWVPPPKPTSKASVVDDLVNRFGYRKYQHPPGEPLPDLSDTEWGSPFCLAMLAILGLVFRILVLISLQLKDRQQRR